MKNNEQMKYGRSVLAAVGIVLGLLLPARTVFAQGATTRFDQFISAQGTFCKTADCPALFNAKNTFDFVIWINNIHDTPSQRSADSLRCAIVDYAGLATDAKNKFGTTITGTVTERQSNDGTAEVTVILHTNNALTWVIAGDANTPNPCGNDLATQPLLFGTRFDKSLANAVPSGASATLGDSFLKVVFKHYVGEPLPDLVQLIFSPSAGQVLLSISFSVSADGPLRSAFGVPDGTPGQAHVVQTGLFATQFKGATIDAFPVEIINLKKTGK